jgi:predicted ester cyclase
MGIAPTGRTVDFDSLNIARFRDGRGYQHKVLMNDVKMMTQLGVMPESPS